jgi:hypothetical protein
MVASKVVFIAMLATAASIPVLMRAGPSGGDPPRPPHEIAWPSSFEGRPLTQLPLSAVERRFAAQFPGQIGRFTDGERTLIVRVVQTPTRLLHPASDCFRGLGYRADPSRTIKDRNGTAWSCFVAHKDGQGQRVCERIHDAEGGAWTDVSAWYWAALLGRTRGPWTAVTTAGEAPPN